MHFGLNGRPFFVNTAHNMGPKYLSRNFFKLYPFKFWFFIKILLRNFKIGSFGANWQTPICPKWLAVWDPKSMNCHFFHETYPFKLGFYVEIDHKCCPQCGYLVYIWENEQQTQGAWHLPHKFHLHWKFEIALLKT